MKLLSKIVACALGACAALAFTGCGGIGMRAAAEVNGEAITEDTVTKAVENTRLAQDLQEEDAWGLWLISKGYTVESFREKTINDIVDAKLRLAGAQEKGIEISEQEIDEAIASLRGDRSDKEWQTNLDEMGLTEKQMRDNLRDSIVTRKIQEKFNEETNPTEEELLTLGKEYSLLYDGAKRSSHIVFEASNQEQAQSVLDQINNGALGFENAVAQYSIDEVTKTDGGDVGWDIMIKSPSGYQEALAGLDKGEVSELVLIGQSIYIIKCTDVFTAPEGELSSFDSLPEGLSEMIKSQAVDNAGKAAYQEWFAEIKENATIVINEMPKGLSYNVDVTKYQNVASNKDKETPVEGNPEVSGSALVEEQKNASKDS